MPLYSFQPSTNSFYPAPEPSPYNSYYFFDECTQSYAEFEPTPVQWTEFFEEPSVSLYSYEPAIESYHEAEELSPFVSYFTVNEETGDFESF